MHIDIVQSPAPAQAKLRHVALGIRIPGLARLIARRGRYLEPRCLVRVHYPRRPVGLRVKQGLEDVEVGVEDGVVVVDGKVALRFGINTGIVFVFRINLYIINVIMVTLHIEVSVIVFT